MQAHFFVRAPVSTAAQLVFFPLCGGHCSLVSTSRGEDRLVRCMDLTSVSVKWHRKAPSEGRRCRQWLAACGTPYPEHPTRQTTVTGVLHARLSELRDAMERLARRERGNNTCRGLCRIKQVVHEQSLELHRGENGRRCHRYHECNDGAPQNHQNTVDARFPVIAEL
eukprot:scaffold98176_cov34-Tisochrysis_lutea.AAC.2